jgi:hypothetical protein
MVEISMSGSGEGPVWVTGRGYSTMAGGRIDTRYGRKVKNPRASFLYTLGLIHENPLNSS